MRHLEDSLAEQCLSKTLYPNTKIYVSRKKVEGTLMTYTNEIEVEIDFSEVDPSLLKSSLKKPDLADSSNGSTDKPGTVEDSSDHKKPDVPLDSNKSDSNKSDSDKSDSDSEKGKGKRKGIFPFRRNIKK